MISKGTRKITEAEKLNLLKESKRYQLQLRRFIRRCVITGLVISLVLIALALAGSKSTPPIICELCVAAICLIVGWTCLEERVKAKSRINKIQQLLDASTIFFVRIQSDDLIEIAETEDEGVTYAFQVTPDKIAVFFGQFFYETNCFPNSDFEVTWMLDVQGNKSEISIHCYGKKLKPAQTISLPQSKREQMIEEFQLIQGKLTDFIN